MTEPTSIKTLTYGEIFLYLQNEPIRFNFLDEETSERVFRENNRDCYFVLSVNRTQSVPLPSRFYIYIGNNPWKDWEEEEKEYVIHLTQIPIPGPTINYAASEDDRKRIRQQLWCAANAKITLCAASGEPVLAENGKPIQTTIGLGFNSWYGALYEHVRTGLELLNRQANITTPFEQLAQISQEALSNPERSDSLVLYLRIKKLLPNFTACVDAIAKAPAQKMALEVKHYASSSVASPNYAFHSTQVSLSILGVQRVDSFQGKTYPLAFSVLEGKPTYDIEENFLVCWCIEQVKIALSKVKAELKDFIDSTLLSATATRGPHKRQLQDDASRHQRELDRVDQYIRYCTVSSGKLPISSNRLILQKVNNLSELINYDWRYSRLWKIANLIKDSVSFVDTSSEAVPFQVAPFQDNYEKWCLLKVVKSLEEIGFKPTKKGDLTPLYHNPKPNSLFCEMAHPTDSKQHLKVFYEKRYWSVDNYSERNSYGFWEPAGFEGDERKRTPDISLEFHSENRPYPWIVTLDPTLGASNMNLRKKFLYKETLRVNNLTQDGHHNVKAAWAITPERGPEEGGRPYRLHEFTGFSQGVIILNHLEGSGNRLRSSIETILQRNNLITL
ncbi:DUF2357 domain-containing protein [Phormidium tenue]|uniref:DUF2357 domain-containing protein n=1 Tax=Phormidium tenue NIES-30 TaxID=549789 RepID=A0A1U7IZR4_9CYAN|nr:DUF2357 domain-containing protein [Phormidium tenue]MBD2234081.1 hypothetical protein [Phormidium tenue FACHB-1052]OKH44681.1 hypothetical protein NIES30_21960 [Phormidium tenue NIES-30]